MIKKKEPNLEDKKTRKEYIKNHTENFDKEKNKSYRTQRHERYKFDLHGFTLDEANKKVKEILEHCIKNNFRELLLITGKGLHSTSDKDTFISKNLGKLKHSVPEFIKTNSELNKLIISITDADKKDGGAGAIIIKLKNL